MPLPHFTRLITTGSPGGPGTKPQEVVYMNLFEVTFVLPTILQAQGRDPILMLQNALKIDLNLTEADIKKMSPAQRITAAAILYDKARLERGESTQNVSLFSRIVAAACED